jgi:cobalt transporter subunit CbtB
VGAIIREPGDLPSQRKLEVSPGGATKESRMSDAKFVRPVGRAEALKVAVLAFAMGVAFVFVVGFAQPHLLHNATHDARHALSFPCH